MILTNEFAAFDVQIRPSPQLLDRCKEAHVTLRAQLQADAGIKAIRVADFLQGSYPRNTMVKPSGKADVDVVLVTNINPADSPAKAFQPFQAFLEKYYRAIVR